MQKSIKSILWNPKFFWVLSWCTNLDKVRSMWVCPFWTSLTQLDWAMPLFSTFFDTIDREFLTVLSFDLNPVCRKCIYNKISDEELECCPICNTDLGCVPLEKLRLDLSFTCCFATFSFNLYISLFSNGSQLLIYSRVSWKRSNYFKLRCLDFECIIWKGSSQDALIAWLIALQMYKASMTQLMAFYLLWEIIMKENYNRWVAHETPGIFCYLSSFVCVILFGGGSTIC